ncbi:hypothetical protein [Pasteuria penetrans]|uniref:hypothetical protein n=1 Tax=Pasteuria penetrans TaxID=86005 RepID=UPI0011F08FCF|nr:hypothetical protein [Pasteuria penetrans]
MAFLALLFNILMLLHVSLYGVYFKSLLFPSFPHFGALDWSLLSFFSMLIFSTLPLWGAIPRYFSYVYTFINFISEHKMECLRIAQKNGVSKLQWYAVPWMGFIFFLISMACSMWIHGSPTVQTVGIAGWWGSFHWQVLRERRWCAREIEEEVDIRSFMGTSMFFLLLYIIPIYLRIYWDYMTSNRFMGIITLVYTFKIFPTWFHFLIGKRPFIIKSFAGRPGSQELFRTSLFYGDFGRMSLVKDLRKKEEEWIRKYKILIILFFSSIMILTAILMIKDVIMWFQ